MATLQIKPMHYADIWDVVLRDWEAREFSGDYRAALTDRLEESREAFSVRINGQLCLLFGHFERSLYKGSGIVWMVATPIGEENWIPLVRLSKTVIKALSEIYPEVYTATYPNNIRAIRFLTWLGFKKHSFVNNTLTMVRG